MIKRINSLGRKKLPRACMAVSIADGSPRRFSASIELPENDWPHEAVVVIEAMCAGSPTVSRFECGPLNRLKPPRDALLTDITGRNVFFHLKVIDKSEQIGRILGLAENVRPFETGLQTNPGRQGILPVEPIDLGQQLWQLDFREHDVFLLVNNKIEHLPNQLQADPTAYALVYPEIIRRILHEAIHQNVDLEEEDDRWPYLWLKFGKSFHPDRLMPPPPEDSNAIDDWVESVVAEFCIQKTLRDRFTQASTQSEGSRD
jgi:hypothetical protein